MSKNNQYPQHILDQATHLLNCRFKHANRSSLITEKLYCIGLENVTRSLALDPSSNFEQPKKRPQKTKLDKVNPLELMHKSIKLPSLPQAYSKLHEVINNPKSCAEDAAEVISSDPALSAFLLRLVNSSFYSFSSQISTISRAVAVIGIKPLATLALGTTLLEMFKDSPLKNKEVEKFWKHSFYCGLIAGKISNLLGKGVQEKCFVAGLLHDIGTPIYATQLQDHYEASQYLSYSKQIPAFEAELQISGFNHAELGSMILRSWNLPYSLVASVLYHHNEEKAVKHIETSFVYFANIIIKSMGIDIHNDFFIPKIDDTLWQKAGITIELLDELNLLLQSSLKDAFSILD